MTILDNTLVLCQSGVLPRGLGPRRVDTQGAFEGTAQSLAGAQRVPLGDSAEDMVQPADLGASVVGDGLESVVFSGRR